MSGLQGQDRSPRAPVRERRNFDNLANALEFIGAGQVIQVNGDGELVLILRADGGLENDGGELAVLLDPTNPGLVLSAAGLAALVQGVLDIDASGIFVNIGNGLENVSSALAVALAASSGLEFQSGDLAIEAPEGQFTQTTVKTANYTAAWGELVRCDPSGGAFTVTLPTASGNAQRRIVIKNTTSDTTAITIDGNGAETIDGAATVIMATGYASLTLVSDGTNVMII